MSNYQKIIKPVSWTLFGITLMLSMFIVFAVGAVSVFAVILRQLLEAGPPRADGVIVKVALGVIGGIIVLTLPLLCFYFLAAVRTLSAPIALIGWIFSALFHGALSFLLACF